MVVRLPGTATGGPEEVREAVARDGLEDRVDDLLHVLEVQKQSRDWTKDDGQFVPMTTTYLNQERYAIETSSDAPGLCAYCSEPAEPGHTHCNQCESRSRCGMTNIGRCLTTPVSRRRS